jgi:hypothetical protein
MPDNDDITPERKSAIGIAYINATNGTTANRVDWTGTLLSMMGGATQIRKDRMGMEIVKEARVRYRGAIEAMKQEHTSLDAVDICMGITISLDPIIFNSDNPYGKISVSQFTPTYAPAGSDK